MRKLKLCNYTPIDQLFYWRTSSLLIINLITHSHAENGSSSPPNRFSLFSLPPVEFAQHLTSHDAVSHNRLLKIENSYTDNSSELVKSLLFMAVNDHH